MPFCLPVTVDALQRLIGARCHAAAGHDLCYHSPTLPPPVFACTIRLLFLPYSPGGFLALLHPAPMYWFGPAVFWFLSIAVVSISVWLNRRNQACLPPHTAPNNDPVPPVTSGGALPLPDVWQAHAQACGAACRRRAACQLVWTVILILPPPPQLGVRRGVPACSHVRCLGA